jgi:dTDP-4-dehydrorhamnose reductase
MRYLVTGASGYLGGYLVRHLRGTGAPLVAWSGSQQGEVLGVPLRPVDLAEPDAIAAAWADAQPDVVLHAAAWARLGDCYRDPALARRINTDASAVLADLAERSGARLVLVSTDLVFDGERGNYREEDAPAPLSVYGRTKAAAEEAVLARLRSAAVRVSLLFGPEATGRRPSFFDKQVEALRGGQPVRLFADEWRTPVSLLTAARALVEVAGSDVTGLLHVGGPERMTRLEMGQRLAAFLGISGDNLVASKRARDPAPEPRPRDTSLDSARWRSLFPHVPWPAWSDALGEFHGA